MITRSLLRYSYGFRRHSPEAKRMLRKLQSRFKPRDCRLPVSQFNEASRNVRRRRNIKLSSVSDEHYAMQNAGDEKDLNRDAAFGVSPIDFAAYGSRFESLVLPPKPVTPLLNRKLAEGRLWPLSRNPFMNRLILNPKYLEHWDSLSPSEKRAAAAVEYWVRRNMRAAPAHIIENMDLSEFILDRIIPCRRRKTLTVVWSTVHPEARGKLEPHVTQLSSWIIRTIKERCQYSGHGVPFLPIHCTFVYKHDTLPDKLPKKLSNEINALQARMNTTLQDRVQNLRSMDRIEMRMRGVPWFMPYLWSKDEKVRNTRQSFADMEELERRQKEAQKASAAGPSFKV